MKRILSLMMIAWAGVALAADDKVLVLTPREEPLTVVFSEEGLTDREKAFAKLVSKETEDQLLGKELEVRKREFEEATTMARRASEELDKSKDEKAKQNNWFDYGIAIERRDGVEERIFVIEDRLEKLKGEIKQARDAYNESKTTKNNSRDDLPKGEDGRSDLRKVARDAVDTATSRPPERLGPDGKPCPDAPRGHGKSPQAPKQQGRSGH